MRYLVLTGRILYSLIFLMAILGHLKKETIEHASAHGVPMAAVLVPLSGVFATLGGLSIALGFKTKTGAWFVILFLVPVTLTMHAFWKETEAMQIQMQMNNFMKNTALIGAALIISYFGAGPLSFDNKNTPAT